MFKEDKNLYETVFYILPDAIILINNKGTLVGMNDKVTKWLGFKEEDIIGKHLLKLPLLTTKSKIIIAKKFADRMLGREVRPYEIDFKTVDGAKKTGLIRASVVKDENGNVKEDLVLITDTTKDKFLTAQIADAERKYKYLFDNLPYAFAYHKMIFDNDKKPIDYIFEEVNKNFEDLLCLKAKDLIGKNATQVIPDIKKDKMNWIEKYGGVVLTRQPVVFESYSATFDKWFKVAAYSPEDGYFVTIFYDISEDKKNEEELKNISGDMSEKLEELSRMNKVMEHREKKLTELKEKLKDK